MADYDNTDSGAAFKPFDTQRLILQGKVNSQGEDHKCVFVMDETKNGKRIIEVYQRIGVLFENDKGGKENAPDYTGPFNDTRRIAAWKKMKDGNAYMTFSLSDQQSQQSQGGFQQVSADPFSTDLQNDKIPF